MKNHGSGSILPLLSVVILSEAKNHYGITMILHFVQDDKFQKPNDSQNKDKEKRAVIAMKK